MTWSSRSSGTASSARMPACSTGGRERRVRRLTDVGGLDCARAATAACPIDRFAQPDVSLANRLDQFGAHPCVRAQLELLGASSNS